MTAMTASVRGSRRRRLPRLAIQRMRLRVAGPDAHAAVWLLGAGGPVVGEAQASSTPDGMSQAVATATLRAVAAGAPGSVDFSVAHVDVTAVGEDRTVLSVVTMRTPQGSERLFGTSVVRGDVRHAVVRATLAAVNRQVERLLEDA